MNKTLSIALAGFSFIIEEHAYIKLSDYLAALRNSLDADEADEVMHDIEIRMVEIFRDSLGKREVINNEDVEKVIAQLGTPEDIEEQEETYYSEPNSKKGKNKTSSENFNGKKQLFRDPENAKIAGVCSGLAHYVGMDVAWMRIIWVVLLIFGIIPHFSGGILILIYIILWAILPVAQSTSDFLKMKGKPVNFDTIKEESGKIAQFANESAKKVGEFANESAKKAGEFYDENKPYINRAGGEIWNAIKYIIGGIFAVMAISSLVGIFAVIIMFGTNSNFIGAREVSFWIGDGRTYNILLMLMILSSLFMTIIFSLICIKIFSPKTKLRNMGWVLLALFIAMMSLGVYFGVNMANQETMLNGNKEETEEIAINTNSDSLLIDIKQVTIPENFKSYDDIDEFFSDKKSVYEEDYPDLNVTRKLNLKSPYLIIKKRANGYNIPLKLDVPVEISGNKILLPNYVKYPYAHRFRDYDVDYELVVPEKNIVVPMNKKIDFSGDLDGDGIDDGDDDEYANTHNSFSSGEDSEIRNVAKFTGIDVSTGVNVNFTQSDNQKVLVEADSDDMKHLITKVENGTLKIYIDNKGKSFLRLGDFSVSVSAPDLERISTSSGAEFSASNTLKQNDFKISADSGSRFRADLEAKNNVNINISSSSDIEIDMKSKSVNFTADSGSSATLTGNTNKAIYHLSSAASCDAENFLAKEADANVSSGGSLKLNVSESLNSKTSSAGSVRYSGKPKNVTADNSVGGSTKEMD